MEEGLECDKVEKVTFIKKEKKSTDRMKWAHIPGLVLVGLTVSVVVFFHLAVAPASGGEEAKETVLNDDDVFGKIIEKVKNGLQNTRPFFEFGLFLCWAFCIACAVKWFCSFCGDQTLIGDLSFLFVGIYFYASLGIGFFAVKKMKDVFKQKTPSLYEQIIKNETGHHFVPLAMLCFGTSMAFLICFGYKCGNEKDSLKAKLSHAKTYFKNMIKPPKIFLLIELALIIAITIANVKTVIETKEQEKKEAIECKNWDNMKYCPETAKTSDDCFTKNGTIYCPVPEEPKSSTDGGQEDPIDLSKIAYIGTYAFLLILIMQILGKLMGERPIVQHHIITMIGLVLYASWGILIFYNPGVSENQENPDKIVGILCLVTSFVYLIHLMFLGWRMIMKFCKCCKKENENQLELAVQ